MKILLVICFLVRNAYSAHECGEYNITGTVRMIKNTPFIVVNEHTLSESVLAIPIEEEPRVAPYLNRPCELRAMLNKKMDGTKGEVNTLKEITLRVPNPLNDKPDTGFTLLKKRPCQK